MLFIYVLELKNKKYYIGKTTNPNFRLKQHFDSNGSSWTREYKPVKLFELISNCDNFDEDKYTLKYMEKYGINNVRGGSFCEMKLSKDNINVIKKMINGSTDNCYICGEHGHFAKDCSQDDYNISEKNYFDLFNSAKCYDNIYSKNNNQEPVCFKCGREGHYSNECYAKTTVTGDDIDTTDDDIYYCSYCNKQFDTLKKVTSHENIYCKKIKQVDNCYRCGREGHYSNECYASKHINGQFLK